MLNLYENDGFMHEYAISFKDYNVFLVRVDCSIVELERREKTRGDRNIGQAKSQIEYFDYKMKYDLVVNTSLNTIDECSNLIILQLDNQSNWTALKNLI